MVHCEEVGLGYWYARRTGGGRNGAWKDCHIGGSSNDMQIAEWESCNGVTAVDFVGEYHWRVGSSGTERLSCDYRRRTGVASVAGTQFSAPPPFRNPVNSTAGPCSANIGLWTNPGGNNARSCGDVHKCHWRDDIWNHLQPHQLVAHWKCESEVRRSEQQDSQAGTPIEGPPCVIWYRTIESETIKQRPTLTLFMQFWDFDESHRYKTKNRVGWRIVINVRIWFQVQVTATPGFHSLYDWCFQKMWLFSGAPQDPEDETVMGRHGAKALYCAVKSFLHAIRTEDRDAQQDAAQ